MFPRWFEGQAPRSLALRSTGVIAGLLAASVLATPATVPGPAQATTPAGACCLAEGRCEFVPRDVCAADGGIFVDEFVPCDPNPCSDALGACCLDDTCIPMTIGDCAKAGGQFLGEGIACDPIPCPNPTETTSWGALKARFSAS